jgi:hypothetical protein
MDVIEADLAAARQVFSGRPTSLIPSREAQDAILLRTVAEIVCRERQLRAALQQNLDLKVQISQQGKK